MTTAPRVSVCIPTRNQARHLSAAISSALAQEVDGLEVIVADDASVDETAAVVASFDHPGVRYLRHAARVGVAANRNACLAVARGDYVAWLDSDDEQLPGALQRQVEVLDAHPEVALVHGGYEVVDVDGRQLRAWPAPFDCDTIESSADAFGHLIAANEMATSTVVVRRTAHEQAGPFATDIGASSTDWEMWLRIALRGQVAYTAERAARYRQHPDSISRATSASGERLRCNQRVTERVLLNEQARISDPIKAAATARAAFAAQALLHAGDTYTRGRRAEALYAVALAGQVEPSTPVCALLAATERGDDLACLRLTQTALGRLAQKLAGTRFGAKLAQTAATDGDWSAKLARAGGAAARVTPPDAVIAAIAKWDPTLLVCSGRTGCNYPDRRLLPDGYPRDGEAAVAHLEALRGARGLTHLVVPAVSAWWLEYYTELAQYLGAPTWRDESCAIFAIGAGT
jgi:glycosyltransferase involved in cell wall biosynthesis